VLEIIIVLRMANTILDKFDVIEMAPLIELRNAENATLSRVAASPN
jgi:hypothetical protein